MIYVTTGGRKYLCTAPNEHRVDLGPNMRQWVVDFAICDNITAAEMDELLSKNELIFIFVDDSTTEERTLVLAGYVAINEASITYNQDLSCTASVQLRKETECNAR